MEISQSNTQIQRLDWIMVFFWQLTAAHTECQIFLGFLVWKVFVLPSNVYHIENTFDILQEYKYLFTDSVQNYLNVF